MSHHGEFLWYDLMTTDPTAAQTFYKSVVGWGTTSWDAGPAPLTMWTVGEVPIGAVKQLPVEARNSGAPSHWLAYVGVSEISKSFALARELGATPMVAPIEIPTVGQIAVVADPQGAVIAMFQPVGDASPSPQEPGRFTWHELMSSDLDSSVPFYDRLFGWNETQTIDMGEAGPYRMYGRDKRSLGGMMRKPAEVPASCWMFYVNVADINEGIVQVRTGGGQLLHGPMEVPGGDHVAACMDPQGAAFALHQANPNANPQ